MIRSSKKLRENEAALVDIISNIDKDYDGLVIIVEGARDEKVLRDLGVRAPIVRTQSGSSRSNLIERILRILNHKSQLLILTDFDREGVEIARFLERELEYHKVTILKRLRREIRKRMGNWRCIEEMCALFKRKDSPEPVG